MSLAHCQSMYINNAMQYITSQGVNKCGDGSRDGGGRGRGFIGVWFVVSMPSHLKTVHRQITINLTGQ